MGMISSGETETWAKARAGDSSAFRSMFDRHRDRVFGLALRHSRSPHDAEDITALVFLELWRRRAKVRVVDGSIIGWLLVTTNNVWHNADRTRRRHQLAMAKLPDPEPQPDHAPDVLDRAEAEARRSLVRDAFSRLSRKDQDVLSLCVIEEMTAVQAAAVLGVPVGTVKSRLSRAKEKFQTITATPADRSATTGGAR